MSLVVNELPICPGSPASDLCLDVPGREGAVVWSLLSYLFSPQALSQVCVAQRRPPVCGLSGADGVAAHSFSSEAFQQQPDGGLHTLKGRLP